ncbi:MAG: late competence development ComFB family protein [Leptolyngbya sp. SIOISBB]|nr:late competence development ComFB family protein [Leptolyngbya sp. SIOISBB]
MGGEVRTAHQKLYINVMETLVSEEVSRQLASLPERVSKYVKRLEVETFALNRLPALYASSEKGLQHQYDRALHEYKPQIVSAVRQAFAAVQVDPIRLSQPLQLNQEEEAVLQALRELLHQPDLNWQEALKEIQRIQHRRQSKGSAPPLPRNPATNQSATDSPTQDTSEEHDFRHSTAWRPGTYGSRIGWKPRHHQPSSDSGFGENAL